MFVRHSLLGITETLKALQVRPQYVTVGFEEKNSNLYVLIHKPTSREIMRVVFRASQFVHDQKYVEKELYKAALWYHGGSIPQQKPSLFKVTKTAVIHCYRSLPLLTIFLGVALLWNLVRTIWLLIEELK